MEARRHGGVYAEVYYTPPFKFGKVDSIARGCIIHLENFEFLPSTRNWRKRHQNA